MSDVATITGSSAAVMPGVVVDGVLRLEHRLGDEPAHVLVDQAVEHRGALAPGANQATEAHLGQVADGEDAEMVGLAESIIQSQTAEIAEMEGLRERL